MASKKKNGSKSECANRPGSAQQHAPLENESVHVFVDDQNLFWGP